MSWTDGRNPVAPAADVARRLLAGPVTLSRVVKMVGWLKSPEHYAAVLAAIPDAATRTRVKAWADPLVERKAAG